MSLKVEELNIADITMLKDLYEASKGIKAYTFHQKYRLAPSVILDFVEKVTPMNYVVLSNDNILQLTSNGKEWILENKDAIYLRPKFKYWRMLPKKDTQSPIEGCYLPDESKIDKNFFEELIKSQ